MSVVDDMVPMLKKLRLSGLLKSLDVRLSQAVDDKLAHEEFLFRLLTDEVERRDAKQLHLRFRRAGFEQQKTIEDFDFAFNRQLPKDKIISLSTCTFVEAKKNVLLVGPTGVGKSHLAQALGNRACQARHSVTFLSANDLFKTLRAARADHSYDRKLQRLLAVDLLIIDDLGLRPLLHDEPLDLYEVVRGRYQRASIVITSNRDVHEMGSLFGDPLLASAAMDRLLHDAHLLTLEGHSFRNPPNKHKDRNKKEVRL